MYARISEAALFFIYAVFFLMMTIIGLQLLKEEQESEGFIRGISAEKYKIVTWFSAAMSAVGFYTGASLLYEAFAM